jgi:acyl-CoA thioesterase-2
LYGGQIVAQALMAASLSVPAEFAVHSLHAYFIRRGDASAPIRFEVDRIRDGRSFYTRRVVARQSTGAILNMSASFQLHEEGPEVQTQTCPVLPAPETLPSDSWSPVFDRRQLPGSRGRGAAWFRMNDEVGEAAVKHACALAYASDDMPVGAVIAAQPDTVSLSNFWATSLDHAIWFHRPVKAEQWHLYDFAVHALGSARGLALGHIFNRDGTHIATVAQELLVRPKREPQHAG